MNDTVVLMITKRCEGCGRGLPIRVYPEAVAFLRGCQPAPPPSLRIESYRCKCRTLSVLTAGDLHFAAA